MIRAIIIDDDPIANKVLEKIAGKVVDLEIVGTCTQLSQARTLMRKKQIDLMFLDVELPGMNGLEFLSTLEFQPQVIVVSSQSKYAIDAYDHNVADYLLKPLNEARFIQAVDRVRRNLGADRLQLSDAIFLKHQRKFVNVPIQDIILVEALGDYVNVHTVNAKMTIYSTLKELMSRLPAAKFVQIHRSHVVNVEHIDCIDDNHVVLGKEKLRISRSHRDVVKARLGI